MSKKKIDIKYTPKYIYQRYDGIMYKLEEIGENEYIDVKTGIVTGKNHLLLGKVSENIVELLESDDIVILEYYVAKYRKRITKRFEVFICGNSVSFNNTHCNFLYDLSKKEFLDGKGYNVKVKSVVIKESFKNIEFEV